MITNEQMTKNRYGRWYEARKKVNWITSKLQAGHTVVIATQLRATQFDKRHIEMFKATTNGAYALYGKKWLCIDGCAIRAY